MRWWTVLFLGALCLFRTAAPAQAQTPLAESRPVAVTVSPQRCLVTAAVPVPAAGTVRFLLPLGAAPESLSLAPQTAGGAPAPALAALSWKRVPLADAEQVATLRKELDTARLARNTVAAQLAALEAQVQFLKTMPGFQPDQAKEVVDAAESMGRRLAELGTQQLPLREEKQRLDREVARLEEQFNQLTGDARQAWEVTARFDAGRAFQAQATYPLSDCGWEPSYRLDARPADKAVAFAYEARVWQRTGEDWKDVRLTLATALPLAGLTPPDIPDWIIQQRPEPVPVAKAMRMNAPMGAGAAMDMAAPAEMLAAAPPMQEERATYTAWDMGQRTIPAGEAPRLEVAAETWPAAFRYTIRPSQGPTAWLTANATLPAVQDLPPGEALFLVDGALAGRQHFALAGNQTDLFFGEAPFIKTTTELVARESGEKGFLSSKQTHRWSWKFTVHNLGKAPAAVRVEEPSPQRRDERMELKVTSTPPARATQEQLLTWEKELKAGDKFVIQHEITLTAPGDMKLDVGWR